jgi:hypothetical protein
MAYNLWGLLYFLGRPRVLSDQAKVGFERLLRELLWKLSFSSHDDFPDCFFCTQSTGSSDSGPQS